MIETRRLAMGKKVRKRKERRTMQDEKAMVGEAMNLAEKIGLEVNLGPDSCCNCCKGLVEVILEYREKGKIFQKLSKIGESKFRKFGLN